MKDMNTRRKALTKQAESTFISIDPNEPAIVVVSACPKA
jgi:hypothetical protein